MTKEFENLRDCVLNAPDGAYEDAKEMREIIGDTVDEFMRRLKELGLSTPNCDQIYNVEVALYNYIRNANPLRYTTAEGFGATMETEARERVVEQSKANVEFFKNRGVG